MNRGQKVADAAAALVGTRFRLHGRVPATGLDCVGLVHCALEAAGIEARVPDGYRLRNLALGAMLDCAQGSGLEEATGCAAPGDILLVHAGPAQHHLYVALGKERFVHAHAGLRQVVLHHGAFADPVLRHWRPQTQG